VESSLIYKQNKLPEGRCIMHAWMCEQLIGLSVKSWDELMRAIMLGANMVEIKFEKFAENGTSFYVYRRNGRFYPDRKNLGRLTSIAEENNISIQSHLPIERCVDVNQETGINVGFLSHHEPALRRFVMLEEIYRERGIFSVNTVHPSTISFDEKQILKIEEALENARIFFEKLDAIRLREKHQTLIGLENQTAPKFLATCLGDHSDHFKKMLRNTRTIGTTIDSGHRLLAEHFTVTELLGFSLPPVNFHFHGNAGEFRLQDFNDDQHMLPMHENVKGYDNYIRYFCRHRTPIVLELSHLEKYSDKELTDFIANLKRETK